MGRVKASEWHLSNSSTVAPWAVNEAEAAMQDDSEEQLYVTKPELDTVKSKMLRILLGNANNQPLVHATLRSKALAGGESDLRKCVVDLAILSLVEQGLLSRHGYGNTTALYTIPQDAIHEATELAYLEFSTEDNTTYSIQQHHPSHHQQQPAAIFGFAPPLAAPPCSIFRPASPRPRSARSYSAEKMSSALHRVRLHGKRSHNSTNSLNSSNLEDSPGGGGGGGGGFVREKRARLGRASQSLSNNNGPVPMSP